MFRALFIFSILSLASPAFAADPTLACRSIDSTFRPYYEFGVVDWEPGVYAVLARQTNDLAGDDVEIRFLKGLGDITSKNFHLELANLDVSGAPPEYTGEVLEGSRMVSGAWKAHFRKKNGEKEELTCKSGN